MFTIQLAGSICYRYGKRHIKFHVCTTNRTHSAAFDGWFLFSMQNTPSKSHPSAHKHIRMGFFPLFFSVSCACAHCTAFGVKRWINTISKNIINAFGSSILSHITLEEFPLTNWTLARTQWRREKNCTRFVKIIVFMKNERII